MQVQDLELLPGFVFRPSDEILLNHFLRQRIVHGFSSAPDYLIKEFNVYSTEPWNLPCDSFKYQDEGEAMLFFTPRHPASSHKPKNVNRTVGTGCWKGKAKNQSIKIDSNVIGHKTQLNFKIKKGAEEINTDWIMHEYWLSRSSSTTTFEDLVLCRIHKKKKSNDDGCKTSRGQQEGAERSLSKRRHAEEDESASLPSSSSLASWHMVPSLQSVEKCEAPSVDGAVHDNLSLDEAPSTAEGGLFSVNVDWVNMQISFDDDFLSDTGNNDEL